MWKGKGNLPGKQLVLLVQRGSNLTQTLLSWFDGEELEDPETMESALHIDHESCLCRALRGGVCMILV